MRAIVFMDGPIMFPGIGQSYFQAFSLVKALKLAILETEYQVTLARFDGEAEKVIA